MSGDLQAATGQLPYEPTRCTCRDLSTVYVRADDGTRKACSNSNCQCKRFVAEEVANAQRPESAANPTPAWP